MLTKKNEQKGEREMIQILIENKWTILGICEPLAWFFLIPMAYFRYRKPNKLAFVISTIVSGFLGYVPHVTIPILIAIHEKSIAPFIEEKSTMLFVAAILLLFLYGATKGKQLVITLDEKLKKKFEQKKSTSIS